jgi:hypothetical protein
MLAALRAAFREEVDGVGAPACAADDGLDEDDCPASSTSSSDDDDDDEGTADDAGDDASPAQPALTMKPWRPSLRLPRPPKAAAASAALAGAAHPAPGAGAPLGAEGRLLALPPPPPPGPSASKAAAVAWFALPSPPGGVLTAEQKRDLRLLRLRGALDPTRHYRAADSKKLPTHFAVGTVIEGPGEWHSARLNRKARGRTLADELLADAGAAAVRKRRYGALQAEAGRWAGKRGSKRSAGGAARLKKRKPKPKH